MVGEAASVREALALAGAVAYDVVFLDISMPGGTGMEAAQALLELPRRPAVVFVTAHDDFAVQAFSVDAVDYLLKPVDEGRPRRPSPASPPCAPRPRPHRPRRRCGSPSSAGSARTSSTGTTCSAPRPTATTPGCADGRRGAPDHASLRELEDASPEPGFCRIHRSCLVNVRRVVALEQAGAAGRCSWTTRRTRLEVARRQTRGLKELLGI